VEQIWRCILGNYYTFCIFYNCDDFLNYGRYLKVAEPAALPPAWSYLVNFRFSVLNQIDGTKFSRHVESKNFKHKVEDWGFPQFMKLTQLKEEGSGYPPPPFFLPSSFLKSFSLFFSLSIFFPIQTKKRRFRCHSCMVIQ
jgi:hypothetical protein